MTESELLEQAKQDYPGFVKYEIIESGDLYLWSYGAYPSIIKNYGVYDENE